MCGDENADAVIGSCAGGNAREGRVVASGPLLHDGASLQGVSVQLFRISEEGRAPDEHGSPPAGDGAAVFGVVKKSCKISVRGASNK